MDHGSEFYFRERARFLRRLALVVLGVSVVAGLPFLLYGVVPKPEQERVRVFLDRTPVHFGFEGPEEYVERVNLTDVKIGERGAESPRMVTPVIVPSARRGGRGRPTAPADVPQFSDVVPELPVGEGSSEADLMARAQRRAGSTPVFRSQDLIIDEIIRPHYPDLALAQGIEGKVAYMALIDTLGHVESVELIDGVEGGILEQAAEAAVRQTRFRPFRKGGVTREVYALFRYNFHITNNQ